MALPLPLPLPKARYLSLKTFRKDGRAVATPVWFALEGSTIYLFSAGDAGKVKRLRNNPQVQVAPCDVRGKRLGEWQSGRGALVTDPTAQALGYGALRGKYGWQMALLDGISRLAGRYRQRALVAIHLD